MAHWFDTAEAFLQNANVFLWLSRGFVWFFAFAWLWRAIVETCAWWIVNDAIGGKEPEPSRAGSEFYQDRVPFIFNQAERIAQRIRSARDDENRHVAIGSPDWQHRLARKRYVRQYRRLAWAMRVYRLKPLPYQAYWKEYKEERQLRAV
ncbi:MAG: hypothetical protein A2660_02350 [Candidatus Doudnabacteria bacterium RIFCSPHIGHO2_01_FULL_45_18]|uniref:Uncharacterized protein n=1 Tax=Candidatus Doudnabacteria bacterium RIFCSPHIGHO2_01_FULL_45_18 TaxID=1817823 RepID=A0A1F5NR82_9BACT|nr:MAG: hypothetical protein A2660_02350 [Candidatus Doudnabacteria bacterium RIFCSPHIGHO2_01_FULL_45_18]